MISSVAPPCFLFFTPLLKKDYNFLIHFPIARAQARKRDAPIKAMFLGLLLPFGVELAGMVKADDDGNRVQIFYR
jgi:hypothetical protein